MSASTTVYALVTMDSYSKPLSCRNGLEWKENRRGAEVTQNMSCLDLKHDEHRRARISRGYKARELQPHYNTA